MAEIPTVAVINESTVAKDLDIALIVNALHKQVWRDVVPVYGAAAKVNVVCIPKGYAIPVGARQLAILDNSDQAGALGYHDVDQNGNPIGKVFAEEDIKYGSSLSVTISHELLEMLGDPSITKTFDLPGPGAGEVTQYAYELCDACEDDTLGYRINGVLLSDFVYPAWFSDPKNPAAGPYDFCGKIEAPLQLLAGGYIGTQLVKNGVPQGWTQITAQGAPRKPAHSIMTGSRRHRRMTGARKVSTVKHREFCQD